MSRRNKKRTKRYHGEDAKHLQAPVETEPVVRHYSAVDRGTLGQWWFEKKRIVKRVAIVVGVGGLIIWSLVELFRAIF